MLNIVCCFQHQEWVCLPDELSLTKIVNETHSSWSRHHHVEITSHLCEFSLLVKDDFHCIFKFCYRSFLRTKTAMIGSWCPYKIWWPSSWIKNDSSLQNEIKKPTSNSFNMTERHQIHQWLSSPKAYFLRYSVRKTLTVASREPVTK